MDAITQAQHLKELLESNIAVASAECEKQQQAITAAEDAMVAASKQVDDYTSALEALEKLISILSPSVDASSQTTVPSTAPPVVV